MVASLINGLGAIVGAGVFFVVVFPAVIGGGLGAIVAAGVLIGKQFAALRGYIYDKVISNRLTAPWYKCVLEELQPGSCILDVGIGTGGALCANKQLAEARDITVVGLDYDHDYIVRARQNTAAAGMCGRVQCVHASVYDMPLPAPTHGGALYDTVYFSGSIVLMPDPAGALKAVTSVLKPGGRILITQTFQLHTVPGFSLFKPLLRYITSIDFGALTFEKDLRLIVASADMKMEEYRPIPNSVHNYWQTARLVVLDPARPYGAQ